MKSEEITLHRALSWSDIHRLKGFDSIYETNQGKLLARSKGKFILLEPSNISGIIPEEAMFAAPYAHPVSLSNGISWQRRINAMLSRCRRKSTLFAAFYEPRGRRKELSGDLSEFIWPQNRDAIQVQIRSSEAGLPSPGKLKVVFGNAEHDCSAEFCLAACVDGTVKWLREFEYNEEGHIWTMHLFDRRMIGEPAFFSQRLKRKRPISSCNNCGNHIGNNVNHNGIQIKGDVSSIQR